MENILVATDLSSNSASAIRFARNFAQFRDIKLVIVYVYHVRKPHSWRTQRFEAYLQVRDLYLTNKFNKFLEKIFK
ncbi:MAG: universal stress protein, partial [Flavobacterium sp.]